MSKFVYSLIITLFLLSPPVFGEWLQTEYQDTKIYTYVPSTNVKNKKRSLMVNLHGCRQKSENLRDNGNWENAAEEWNMIVSIPEATDGGVIVGCWNYFGKDQSMKRSDVSYLVTWIDKLLKNKKLNIDRHQIYISGFSSGATMAMVIGCIRPDLIAGIAPVAGPAIGTKYYQSQHVAIDSKKAAKLCKKWAGKYSEHLETQTSAVMNGNFDIIVSPGHSKVNVDFYRLLTKSNLAQSNLDLKSLPGQNKEGDASQWSDDWSIRVTHIVNKGLGHNWPSGVGPKWQDQVTGDSINFPSFLGEYFYKNNRRRR